MSHNWQSLTSIESDKLVLLRYRKKRRSTYRVGVGRVGVCITSGYFDKSSDCWFDYTDRLLSTNESKSGNNVILNWMPLPEEPNAEED